MNQRRCNLTAILALKAFKAVFALGVMLGLGACEGKLAQLPDAELQDSMYQCNTTTEQSPGFAITCDNYRRECARRRDEGRFVC